MIKTYEYRLIVNDIAKGDEFYFPYGNTRRIRLKVSRNKASICVQMRKKYDDPLSAPYLLSLLKEGIKRILLIHIIKYGRNLKQKSIKLFLGKGDGGSDSFDLTGVLTPYSLVGDHPIGQIPKNLRSKDVIQAMLKEFKSNFGSEMAAIYSLIYVKTKSTETERFFFLWMSFNGTYSMEGSINKQKKLHDNELLGLILRRYGWGQKSLDRATRERLAERTKRLLSEHGSPSTVLRDLNDSGSVLYTVIFEFLSSQGINVSPYGYVLVEFGYYLRCTLFHSSKPIPLFCFEDDEELKILRIVNTLLEDFLDSNLATILLKARKETV